MQFNIWFKLNEKLSVKDTWLFSIIGVLIILVMWWILAESFSIDRPIVADFEARYPEYILQQTDEYKKSKMIDSFVVANDLLLDKATSFEKVYPILPRPIDVFSSYPIMIREDHLIDNLVKSIWLNLQGYIFALLISIPLGFLIGLFPIFQGLWSKPVDALRYLPLTALTGIFIIWFGIEDGMKVAFLAFGIIVYLLPIVVQRVLEVDDTHLKTVYTLKATSWQTIRSVHIPEVLSKLIDDIRVLTAISWTYIIIVEMLNRTLGVGGLLFIKTKMGQVERAFAILMIIILIGFLQDRLFGYIDRRMFIHKYEEIQSDSFNESKTGISLVLILLTIMSLIPLVGFNVSNFTAIWSIVGLSCIAMILFGEWKINIWRQSKKL